jgi:penicillin-binding protein-related factor A (putative recombinase)
VVNEFEKEIETTFQDYRDARIATLYKLNPPMRIAGMHGRVPCFVQNGKAPYDVMGFFYNAGATSIGVELKQTRHREASIKILGPEQKGGGVQYHQLEGMVDLHKKGGVACLLWNNAGEVGRMDGAELVMVKQDFDAARKMKNPPKGVKSIAWDRFKAVRVGQSGKPLWLPKAPKTC